MRILYIAFRSGVGGLQTTLRNRILALKARGIHAEVLFVEQGYGGEYLFDHIPFSYIKNVRDFRGKITRGQFDILSFIHTIEFIKHVPSSFKGRMIYEVRGWSPKVAVHVKHIGKYSSVHAIICIAKYLVPLVEKCTQNKIPVYVDGNTVNSMFHFIHPTLRKSSGYPKPRSKSKVIGFVGRAEESKNWREFIQICEQVALTDPIEMWFMSNPNTSRDFEELLKVCASEHLKPMTRILGLVSNHIMPEVYSTIKSSGGCILSTSRREGLGNAILEPMACGLPVVSSDVPGKNEVITHAINGMLYKLGDIDHGAYMVKQMLGNKQLRRLMIRNGLKEIKKNYQDSVYVKKYSSIFESIK